MHDWFHGRGPAPKFWRVRPGVPATSMWWVPPRAFADSRRIAGHWQKEVNASAFAYRGETYDVVVKALNEGHTRHGQDLRSRAAVLFEILYLEVLRGAPGVPELYGGWRTEHGLVWVVQHAGEIIGQGKDRAGRLSILSDAYAAACRDRPLQIARAWFRCLHSIVEGGFVLTCVEIKILRHVRAESSRRPPRHRRDTCSMAWLCRFLTARRSQRGHVIAEK